MNLLAVLPLSRTKLDILFEIYAEGEDYLRNIQKKTGINPSLAHRILSSLTDAGVVTKKKKGKEVYYSLVLDSFWPLVLEKYHLAKAISAHREIKQLVALFLNNRELLARCSRVYLFGSFVNGVVTKKSDIDILFVCTERKEVVRWCRETSLVIGRTISPLIYTSKRFHKELAGEEALLTSIVQKVKNRVILVSPPTSI